jgi:hypothetical protein
MGSGLTALSLPASVEVLQRSCWSDCESLSSVICEQDSTLRTLSVDAFLRSTNLDHLELSPSTQEVLPEEWLFEQFAEKFVGLPTAGSIVSTDQHHSDSSEACFLFD